MSLPVGTNLGLLHLLWMLVSGQLLGTRGAIMPGLSACGLSRRAVRRAWAALGQGGWSSTGLLTRWQEMVAAEGHWQPHTHGGVHPVAVDVTAFWRPRLRDGPTTHYHAEAGQALPAIPVGLIARVGSVGGQRLALPLACVRADTADPRSSTHERLLVRTAVQHCTDDDALVLDAGFGVALLQEEGATRDVVRQAKNATFRRSDPPPYQGQGRSPTRGAKVRPLPRSVKGRLIPATPPERCESWEEDDVLLHADIWTDLVLVDAAPGSPTLTVVALCDPRDHEPLLASSLTPSAPRCSARCTWTAGPSRSCRTDARRRPPIHLVVRRKRRGGDANLSSASCRTYMPRRRYSLDTCCYRDTCRKADRFVRSPVHGPQVGSPRLQPPRPARAPSRASRASGISQ